MEKDQQKFQAVFEAVKNLLTAGAIMAIGFAVEKYKAAITPAYPISSTIAGVIIVLIGLSLSVWAAFHGLTSLYKAYRDLPWLMYLVCGLYLYLWGFVVTALLLIATKNA